MNDNKAKIKLNSFDLQMSQWSRYLKNSVKIGNKLTDCIATSISEDIREIDNDHKIKLIRSISNPISIQDRIDELIAFQGWMDIANDLFKNPCITRAQIIVQNYICFVYLNDSCFKILKQFVKLGSVTKKCCNFLINNPVRAFRNAISHSNWKYSDDFLKIIFHARKGHLDTDPVVEWSVSNTDLAFWQSLARCTAYVAYLSLIRH